MEQLTKDLDGVEILNVWANLPDIQTYFEIFDDYLDFHIFPWDQNGYDDGEMIPERKNAVRLLMIEMQKYMAAHRSQGRGQQEQQQDQNQQDESIYGKVVEYKGEKKIGGKMWETNTREVVMKAPQKEDLEDWNWKKFAYPEDIEAYEKLKKEGRI